MKIIVHYPTDSEKLKELERRVAQEHANAVVNYTKKLSCPNSQKQELIKSILNRRKAG